MTSFQLLSKTMQKKISDMNWDKLTPVQNKTIPVIIETSATYVWEYRYSHTVFQSAQIGY
ncbi:hypothetical protein [Alkalihalobacillus deserti]|uniref:hypothetical protein n=1 Tax=Alkalihalobacillus deserti TaxID=2879466 RepID=UPI001D14A822|nr:hypothetical protein [Alkalihalobacillus deserti]